MKYCSHCGHPNQEDAFFCGSCGRPLNQKNGKETAKGKCNNTTTSKNGGSWVDSLNEYVGNDRPANLNWRVLFTDVFKPHTTEEAEEIFICGTKTTTPNMCSISKDWPRPWLYSRVLLMFVVTFVSIQPLFWRFEQ